MSKIIVSSFRDFNKLTLFLHSYYQDMTDNERAVLYNDVVEIVNNLDLTLEQSERFHAVTKHRTMTEKYISLVRWLNEELGAASINK